METGLERFTDQQIEAALGEAVRQERRSTAQVLRCLIEFERRRLHERKAHPSLFEYCMSEFGYCEQAAYKRVRAAKAAAAYPVILDFIENRRIDLSRVVAIAAHLTPNNHLELLERAAGMKMRELEFYVAGLAPQCVKRDSIRVLSSIRALPASAAVKLAAAAPRPLEATTSAAPRPAEANASSLGAEMCGAAAPTQAALAEGDAPQVPTQPHWLPARAPTDLIDPVNEELARVAFTADRLTVEKIDRACQLMRCRRSNLAPVMARALEALLREIDPDRRLEMRRPQKPRPADPHSRRIPRHVRDAVWRRDAGRCTFVDGQGSRCSARHRLEFDHVRPRAAGGRSDEPANLRLRCRLHNLVEAHRWFGKEFVDRAIAARRRKHGRCSERAPP